MSRYYLFLIAFISSIFHQICIGDTAGDVRKLTGAHTRIVWSQAQDCTLADYKANNSDYLIMGLDTDDGKGERALLKTKGKYGKPLITPKGNRVVFTRNNSNDEYPGTICAINWDGTGLHELCRRAYGMDTWIDHDSIEWVYAIKKTWSKEVVDTVVRFQIDDPAELIKVWDQGEVSHEQGFGVSEDGTRIVAGWPWPNAALLDLTVGDTVSRQGKTGGGCWTSIAPDNSYYWWVFGINEKQTGVPGGHQGVFVYDRTGLHQGYYFFILAPPNTPKWAVTGHPRWSNRREFITVTAGYEHNGHQGDGTIVELSLGKLGVLPHELGGKAVDVDEWVQITDNDKYDAFGEAWVDPAGGQTTRVILPKQQTETRNFRGSSQNTFCMWSVAPGSRPLVQAFNMQGRCMGLGFAHAPASGVLVVSLVSENDVLSRRMVVKR